MNRITISKMASLPFKYVRATTFYGLVVYRNLHIDKHIEKEKIEKKPDVKTIYISFSRCSLNQVISNRHKDWIVDLLKK